MLLICIISVISTLAFFYLHKKYNKNYINLKQYEDFYNHKICAIWQSSDHIKLSKNFQKTFDLKPEETLENTIINLDQKKYNLIINEINQLDASEFCLYFSHKNTTYELHGYKHKDMYVLECFNQNDFHSQFNRLKNDLEEIKEYSHILEHMLNLCPIPMWYRGPDHTIKLCNKAYANIMETTIQDVLQEQKELVSRSHPQSPFMLCHEAIAQSKKQSIRLYTTLNRKRHYLELCENPVKGQCTIGYAFDLSALDMIEKQLDRTISTYQDVFHQITTPIVYFKEESQLEFCNTAYIKLFDFEKQFLDKKPYLFDVLDDLRRRQKIPEPPDFFEYKKRQRQLFKDRIEPFEEIMHLPNGKILCCLVRPQPSGGILFMYQDITEHTHLEQEFKILNAVQQQTIDHLFEGILVFGGDHKLRFSNKAIDTIFDLKERHIGLHLSDFIHKTTHKMDWKNLLLELFEKRVPFSKKLNFKNRHDVLLTYSPLPDGSHLLSFIDLAFKVQAITSY